MTISTSAPRESVFVRQAGEADAESYRRLRLEALRDYPEAFSDDYEVNLTRPPSFWVERLRVEREDRAVMTCLATANEKPIGMGSIVIPKAPKTAHSGTIVGMYVRPAWRGQHVAERVIGACLDWARSRNSRIVKLAVVTTNTAAVRCYVRCGFQVYGVEPQALRIGGVSYDELLMARLI